VGDNDMVILQPHLERGIGKSIDHLSIKLYMLFFSHYFSARLFKKQAVCLNSRSIAKAIA
jgi:hypothetical protein